MQDDELAEGDFIAVLDVVTALESDFEGFLGFRVGVDVLQDEVRPQVSHFFGSGETEFLGGEDFFDIVLEVDGEGFGLAVLATALDGFLQVDRATSGCVGREGSARTQQVGDLAA